MRDTRSIEMIGLDTVIDDVVQVLASSDVMTLTYTDGTERSSKETDREWAISVEGVQVADLKAVTNGASCSVWIERSKDGKCLVRLADLRPGRRIGDEGMRSLLGEASRLAGDMLVSEMPAVDLGSVMRRYVAAVEDEGYDVEEMATKDGAVPTESFAVRQNGMPMGRLSFTAGSGLYSVVFEPSTTIAVEARPVYGIGLDPARDKDRIVGEKTNGVMTRLLDGIQFAADEIESCVRTEKVNEETLKVVLTESVARSIAGLVGLLVSVDPAGFDRDEVEEVLDFLATSPHAAALDLAATRDMLDANEVRPSQANAYPFRP